MKQAMRYFIISAISVVRPEVRVCEIDKDPVEMYSGKVYFTFL